MAGKETKTAEAAKVAEAQEHDNERITEGGGVVRVAPSYTVCVTEDNAEVFGRPVGSVLTAHDVIGMDAQEAYRLYLAGVVHSVDPLAYDPYVKHEHDVVSAQAQYNYDMRSIGGIARRANDYKQLGPMIHGYASALVDEEIVKVPYDHEGVMWDVIPNETPGAAGSVMVPKEFKTVARQIMQGAGAAMTPKEVLDSVCDFYLGKADAIKADIPSMEAQGFTAFVDVLNGYPYTDFFTRRMYKPGYHVGMKPFEAKRAKAEGFAVDSGAGVEMVARLRFVDKFECHNGLRSVPMSVDRLKGSRFLVTPDRVDALEASGLAFRAVKMDLPIYTLS